MELKVNLDSVYAPSQDVVAREIHGEFIIVPITSAAAGLDEEIFTLNDTGKAIWDKLDGKRSLKEAIRALSLEFEGSAEEIEKDVIGLAEELFKRKMLVETQAV
ncbi:MAG: PqqD family protein [Candidatus Omnitrophota bacterium]